MATTSGFDYATASGMIKDAAKKRGYDLNDQDVLSTLRNTGYTSGNVGQDAISYITGTAIPQWEDKSKPATATTGGDTTTPPPSTRDYSKWDAATIGAAPPGFDAGKWVDPAHTSEKYTVGRILAMGGTLADAARAIGGSVLSNDWLKTKSGEVFDALYDVGGPGQRPQWERQDFDANGNWIPPNFGGANASTTAATAPGNGNTSNNTATTNSALYDRLVEMLMGRATQSLNVDRNSPTIRQQADPYAANVERERRNYLADLAESAGPLANLQGKKRLSYERAGQATGLYESQLIGKELTDRRTEIQQALTQLGSLLTSQQQMALQEELARIDDATRRLGLNFQNDQFYADLGLRAEDLYNKWDAINSGVITQ